MSEEQNNAGAVLAPGRYRHYKGGEYRVYGVGRHSETEELMVIYRPLYGAGDLWLRPLEMFTELVEVEGKSLERFRLIESDISAAKEMRSDDPFVDRS